MSTMYRTTNLLSSSRSALLRRHASTTAKASETASGMAAKAKEATGNVTSKASEGLSKVSSSAGPAISGAANRVGGVLSRIGGRTGRLITGVQSLIPPAIYYSRVTLELSRLIFQAQKMSPPSLQAFQTYAQPLLNAVRSPMSAVSRSPAAQQVSSHASHIAQNPSSTLTPERILSTLRNVDRRQLASGGVILAEVLGFFTVGEMVGRMKLVGYRGDREHHETATPHEGV